MILSSKKSIDTKLQAEYHYTHTKHPEKHLEALIRFLIEQQRKGREAIGDSR